MRWRKPWSSQDPLNSLPLYFPDQFPVYPLTHTHTHTHMRACAHTHTHTHTHTRTESTHWTLKGFSDRVGATEWALTWRAVFPDRCCPSLQHGLPERRSIGVLRPQDFVHVTLTSPGRVWGRTCIHLTQREESLYSLCISLCWLISWAIVAPDTPPLCCESGSP